MTEASEYDQSDLTRDLRQLALVDRIIGLEAEVARLSSRPVEPIAEIAEIERLHNELGAVYGSRAWRVGNSVLRPVRVIRRLGRS